MSLGIFKNRLLLLKIYIYFINLLIILQQQYLIRDDSHVYTPGVSFTKLREASYDQLTCRRSHELILLMNCYIALSCVVYVLPCVAPCYAVHHELCWYVRTRRMNSTYKHLCERPPGRQKLPCCLISEKIDST